MAKLQVFCWHDKVDGTYMPDSILLNRFQRPVFRGFLTQFERDRKMRIDEYELCKIGEFDDETGVLQALPIPEVLDPYAVLQDRPDTKGQVKDE